MLKIKRILIFFLLMLTFSSCGLKKEENGLLTKKIANYNEDKKELSKIVETINMIDQVFVGEKEIDKDILYEEAIRGILLSLEDPYSEYYNKEEIKSLEEQIDGEYSGVGMSIRKEKGQYLEVVSPFIGSPAYKAGILIGDKITKIDGEDTKPLTSTETSKKLKGKKGTKVEIEVLRKANNKLETITLIRDDIKLEQVETKMLTKEIGYISLLEFGTDTGKEIENAIKKLKDEGMKKLIFDLRTNPGGSLSEAVDIASLFTKEKLMVTLNYKNDKKVEFTRTLDYQGDFDMVILVNGASASASEIVTGILKDYKRATIIGEKTYGKGVAQSIFKFKTGDAIKLTVAKYETPKNNNINKVGISPDIRIPMNMLIVSKGYFNETKEAQENRKDEIFKILEKTEGREKALDILKKGDIQLNAAIDFLNGKKVKSVPEENVDKNNE